METNQHAHLLTVSARNYTQVWHPAEQFFPEEPEAMSPDIALKEF